jgi:hypothetical protein
MNGSDLAMHSSMADRHIAAIVALSLLNVFCHGLSTNVRGRSIDDLAIQYHLIRFELHEDPR